MSVPRFDYAFLVLNFIQESLAHWTIWQVCLNNTVILCPLENIFVIDCLCCWLFSWLSGFDYVRSEVFLFNSDLWPISVGVHFGAILVMAVNTSISVGYSNDSVFSDHHFSPCALVSFHSTRNGFQVFAHSILELSSLAKIIREQPLKFFLRELCRYSICE